jgi:hypothetical protein
MAPLPSRRAFLAGVGGGLASASLAFGLWKYHSWTRARELYPVAACCNYVDYSGWILTRADKAGLTAKANMRLIEGTIFSGHDIADRTTENVDACSSWCLEEPDCQGFSYAKSSHPDPRLRNRCWLKGTSRLTPVADPNVISGAR